MENLLLINIIGFQETVICKLRIKKENTKFYSKLENILTHSILTKINIYIYMKIALMLSFNIGCVYMLYAICIYEV